MGTRHLIMIMHKGEYEVSQYGQFDGYPNGRGVAVLEILRNTTPDKFREKMANVSHYTLLGLHKRFERVEKLTAKYQKQGIPNPREKAYEEWAKENKILTREFCENVLTTILGNDKNETIKVKLDLEFAAASLFCEWAYVIDLDKETLEVYRGFNKKQLGSRDRFKFLEEFRDMQTEYHPIKLVASFDLNQLPSDEDFIQRTDPPEKE